MSLGAQHEFLQRHHATLAAKIGIENYSKPPPAFPGSGVRRIKVVPRPIDKQIR